MPLSAATLALLACPVCHGNLAEHATASIRCISCGRVYPVRDDIPVLIAAEASTLDIEAENRG